MEHTPRRTALLLLLAALGAVLPGCASSPFRALPGLGGPARGFSQEELADDLNAFAARFAGLVSTATEEISAGTDDPVVRRRALLFGLRLNPAVQEAAFHPNPREGYLRVLTITVMLRYYLTTGDGRSLFGDAQPIAVATAETLEAGAYAIGGRFLSSSELRRVRAEVARLAERYPIQGTQFSLVRASQAAQEVPQQGALYGVITLPLAPFRALQGVDTGAAAIRDFNQTARRMATIAAALPGELRGEMQLLLLDAEELRVMRQGLAAFELAAASAERASLALERLPDDLRATLDVEGRGLLAETREPLGQAAEAVTQAAQMAGPLQETARQVREASALWREILGPHDPAPRGPDERPFDVREWEASARTVGATAVDLRELAAELQRLSTELQGVSGGALLDRLFWRAVALLAAFFGLLLAYRLVATRLARRAAP